MKAIFKGDKSEKINKDKNNSFSAIFYEFNAYVNK